VQELRVTPRGPRLPERDPRADLGFARSAETPVVDAIDVTLRDLQARLTAEGRSSLLVVLQGLDASGKDGAVRRLCRGINPMGVRVTSFKRPSELELAHTYLWRIEAALPRRGEIGVFNRSHYEDLVTTRVLGLIDAGTQRRRIAEVNAWESRLVAEGTAIVKVFLRISKDEQRRRLQARIDDPTKHWKFNLSDLETRSKWDEHHQEYDRVLRATSTDVAPWFVVPADRKWVRDRAVAQLVVEALAGIDPQYPTATGWDPATTLVD
jgi:PPK2 family polyphosphate:nucleotide phosphotransferase